MKGELQTVYRAELSAVAHVLTTATNPTRIVSDCQAVVNQVARMLQGAKHDGKGDHADLWAKVEEEINDKEPGYYEVEWINSHIDPEKAEAVERAGGFLASHIYGNANADLQAKEALALHPINHQEYSEAEDRIFLAAIGQALIVKIWQDFFQEDMGEEDTQEGSNRELDDIATNLIGDDTEWEEQLHSASKQTEMEKLERQCLAAEENTYQQMQQDNEEEAARWLHGSEEEEYRKDTLAGQEAACVEGSVKESIKPGRSAPDMRPHDSNLAADTAGAHVYQQMQQENEEEAARWLHGCEVEKHRKKPLEVHEAVCIERSVEETIKPWRIVPDLRSHDSTPEAVTAGSQSQIAAPSKRKRSSADQVSTRACDNGHGAEQGSDLSQEVTEEDKSLAKKLRAENPAYFSNLRATSNTDSIRFPDANCSIEFQPRGHQQIPGRGKVNIGLKHPRIYVDYVRRWLNLLEWRPRTEDEHLNTPGNTITHLELLVDFELTTGIKIGDEGPTTLSWAERARLLGYYIKTIARVYMVELNGMKTGFTKAMRPILDAASLAPFGAPVLSGYARKPYWTHQGTPSAIATNVWKARQNDIISSESAANRRNRSFAHRHNLNLSGYRLGQWLMASSKVQQEPHSKNAKRKHEDKKANDFARRVEESNGRAPTCSSCCYNKLQTSDDAFAIPHIKGFRWRRLKVGDLICEACHNSWKRDKLCHEQNLNQDTCDQGARKGNQEQCTFLHRNRKHSLSTFSTTAGAEDSADSRPKYTREQKAAPDPYLKEGETGDLHRFNSRKRDRSPDREGANSSSSHSGGKLVEADSITTKPRWRRFREETAQDLNTQAETESPGSRSSCEAVTAQNFPIDQAEHKLKAKDQPKSCKENSG